MHYMVDTDYDRLKPSNFFSYINFTLLFTIHYSASMEGSLLAILLTQLWGLVNAVTYGKIFQNV